MLYRRFGRTEIKMPVLSCGGMRYQYKWQDTPLNEIPLDNQVNLENTIKAALTSGINHIETARGYGSSERQLGQILPTIPRQELIIQTKIAPNSNPEEFVRLFHNSRNRLNLEYVDLLALHGINNEETLEWSIQKNGCLQAARNLVKEGFVRHVGFSTHGPLDIILSAISHSENGGFDYVNLHWYYINQKNWPAIQEANKNDMGVFIISPSDKGGLLYKPSPTLLDLTFPWHPIVFNDLFCLMHPEVHTISIGANKPTDFDLHLEAVKLLNRAQEIVAPIHERMNKKMISVFGNEFVENSEIGLPSWKDTPGQINIPVILHLYKLAKAYGMVEYGQMRYNLFGNGGHWFPGQNAANIDEYDVKSVLQNSPFSEQIPGLLKEAHHLLAKEAIHRLSES